jgi:hypothetical protein
MIMISSRRRWLLCAALAAATLGVDFPTRAEPAASRRRNPHPGERSYGLIEDLEDRQQREFLARNAPPHAPNCRVRPA